MFKKKYIVIAVGIVCILLGSFFVNNVLLAQSSGEYDPWLDLNDDGVIDVNDLQILALIYASSGDSINKTELLLELEARLNSLNASLLTDYYNITECNVIFVDASGDIITGYLNVDSGTLYVDDVNDRVGIGTTSPNGQLQVKGSGATTDWITIEGSYGGSLPTIRSGEFLYIRAGDAGNTQCFRGSELRTGTLDVGYNAVASITTANVDEDLTIDPNGAGDIILLGKVGVGITDPATLLDVAGDIQAQILKADQIRIGSTEGDSHIYFYDSGGPTGEAIWWYDAGDQFYVSDDIHIAGTISIANDLEGADRIEGNILEGNQIRLGSIEGDSFIFFYEGASPTGEYIYWHDSWHRFYVSDDIHIEGTISIPTTTRYYSIPGSAWQPSNDYYTYHIGYYTYTRTPDTTTWYAPVNLPHGAVVTELRAWLYDNDASDNIDVYLYRQTGGSLTQMASVSSSGESPSYRQFSTSLISDSTIDNQNYAYFVRGYLRSGDSNHRLSQVRITYTIDEPLP